MSFPAGALVNYGINPEVYCGESCKVRLPSIWEYLTIVREVGLKDVVLAKVDLSHGYQQIPACPSNWQHQLLHVPHVGFKFDTRAVFGGSPCEGFMHKFNQTVTWASVNTSFSLKPLPGAFSS